MSVLFYLLQKATKKYAFEKVDVPVESDYLEVRYAVSRRLLSQTEL